jgi:hypothetical protein
MPTLPKASAIKKIFLTTLGSIYNDTKRTELKDHLVKYLLLFKGTGSVVQNIKYETGNVLG